MNTTELILKKILKENGTILAKYKMSQYSQKFFTKDELTMINSYAGDTFEARLQNFVDSYFRSSNISKTEWASYSYNTEQLSLKNQKRKVIKVDSIDEAFPYRNNNCKFLYICRSCGKEVITSYTTLSKSSFICKECRKNESK